VLKEITNEKGKGGQSISLNSERREVKSFTMFSMGGWKVSRSNKGIIRARVRLRKKNRTGGRRKFPGG